MSVLAFRNFLLPNHVGEDYVRALVSAFKRSHSWIQDPDYAHIQDSEAWEKIRRDAEIAMAIQKRRQKVAGNDWSFMPASDEKQDLEIAKVMTQLFQPIRRFVMSRFNLAEATFRGSSYGFIQGMRVPMLLQGDVIARQWWVPQRLHHVDRWRFRRVRTNHHDPTSVKTRWEMFSLAREVWEPFTKTQWFTRHAYEETEDSLGYGRGLLVSLYFYWWALTTVWAQGLDGLENWAQGLRIIKIDGARDAASGKPNSSLVEAHRVQWKKHRAEHLMFIDSSDEFQLHSGPGQGWQMVDKMLDRLTEACVRLILMAVRPTGGGSSGGLGATGQTKEESESSEDVFQFDRSLLSESIDDSLALQVWKRNLPNIRMYFKMAGLPMPQRPKFVIAEQRRADPQKTLEQVRLGREAGIAFKEQEVYERIRWGKPTDDDARIDPVEQPSSFAPGGFPQFALHPERKIFLPIGMNGASKRANYDCGEVEHEGQRYKAVLIPTETIQEEAETNGPNPSTA